MISCLPDGQHTWICELRRAGYRSWIIWNPIRSRDFQIPAAWQVEMLRDLLGKRRSLRPGSVVSIGSMPILLESRTS
jgi:hypothetical protein